MKILLIDTCGATGSLAFADTDLSPAAIASDILPGRTASERLVPAIKSLIAGAGSTLESLDAVVDIHGPGSFTGVRVGLSAAKALCQALGLPLVAISRLAVLAQLATTSADASPNSPAWGSPPHVHALLDAGRGDFYYGQYLDGICVREALLNREEVFLAVDHDRSASTPGLPTAIWRPARIVVVCEPKVAELLAGLAPRLVAEPLAEAALPLALKRIREGSFDDIATIDANYLRRTDAEIFSKPAPVAMTLPQPSKISTAEAEISADSASSRPAGTGVPAR